DTVFSNVSLELAIQQMFRQNPLLDETVHTKRLDEAHSFYFWGEAYTFWDTWRRMNRIAPATFFGNEGGKRCRLRVRLHGEGSSYTQLRLRLRQSSSSCVQAL